MTVTAEPSQGRHRRHEIRTAPGIHADRTRRPPDARGHRLPDRLRGVAEPAALQPRAARRHRVRRPGELRHGADRPVLVDGLRRDAGDHRRLGRDRVRARHGAGAGHAPDHLRKGRGAHRDPDPVRHRHGGGVLQLVLRVDTRHRISGQPAARGQRAADRAASVAGHRGARRGVEDDAVHGAAAARRAGAGAAGSAQRRAGRRRRARGSG